MRSLTAVLILCIVGQIHAQPVPIEYRLSMPEPWTHLFHVEVVFENLPADSDFLDVRLPVWRSGRYRVLDFAGGIVQFAAKGEDNQPLLWSKLDKSTWRIEKNESRSVLLRYSVYANEFHLRTRGLNDEHGFVDGSAVFMYAEEYRSLPLILMVYPFGNWHVTTGLDSLPGERFVFQAPSYDHLIDCPVEIGNQTDVRFDIDGIPHTLSFAGAPPCEVDTLKGDITRVVTMNRDFWGGLPYKRYVFLFHESGHGGGATEHINSTIILHRPKTPGLPSPCSSILGIISHEFFHTWNVKRFRPRGMDPYDWSGENYYRELWIAEGATSYLHNLLMLREGFRPVEQYLRGLCSAVASDRGRPGNLEQSLADCSFDAWIKGSGSRQRTVNYETDFYSRGANVCLHLDLEIRHRSGNTSSFDDVMRTLYRRFPIGSGGYTVEDVERAARELAGDGMAYLFDAFVYGSDPLPWEQTLQYAGLELTVVDTIKRPWLGLEASDREGRSKVVSVVAGSPAHRAGVNVGDELLAFNGYEVKSDELVERVNQMTYGDEARLVVFRSRRLKTFVFALDVPEPPTYNVKLVPDPTDLQKSIFSAWLGAEWKEELNDEL
ncbi:MAG: PDZ domain-containing protein [Bacteroidota bacterium]